ncbi:MAG: glycosyltransferase family 2 protein [Planctomycetes bacterium]|nr:glycosyltransferase family 2 protein [Planctomycetota bacterium]
MTLVSNYLVSIVVPLRDDAEILRPFVEELTRVVRGGWQNYEIVLVDDGSRDGTAAIVAEMLARHECLRYLRLSRSFGVEIAISAGLDTVIGDVVVVLQPDMDPPAMIPRFVAEARKTHGIVFGVRTTPRRERALYALGRRLFNASLRRLLGVHMPDRATLFVAMTRQTMNAVGQIKDKARAVRLFGSYVGFPHTYIEYTPTERRGEARMQGLREGIERGVGLIVTNSTQPLRLMSVLGVFLCVMNMIYVVYIVSVYFFKVHTAEGWTTLSLQHAVMFVFLFAILAVLCEYVGRLLTETRDRPLYFVAEERTSSVMIRDEDRRNVVSEST